MILAVLRIKVTVDNLIGHDYVGLVGYYSSLHLLCKCVVLAVMGIQIAVDNLIRHDYVSLVGRALNK